MVRFTTSRGGASTTYDLGDLPRDDLFFDLQVAVLAPEDVDLVFARLEVGRHESAVGAGNQIANELAPFVRDLDRYRASRAIVLCEQDRPGQPPRRHLLGRRFQLEHVPVANAGGDRFPVFARGLEDELARGRERGFVERLAGRSRHTHFGDETIFPHHDVELDDCPDGLFAVGFRVGRLDETDELRWSDERLALRLGRLLRIRPAR
ncbi:MAG: hypothetical protein JRG93_17485 [Deltaproteobacteria bacterium]|nr:hypothetical protein [Deltaproteobacteria bacterium]